LFVYLIRRLLLLIPTFLGITLVTFFLINLAPGGPVDQKIQQIRFAEGSGGMTSSVTEEMIQELKKQYGFDKLLLERYLIWVKNLLMFDFGRSFTYEEPVIDVIQSKLPVSMQFGFVSLFLTYLICIPLGVKKAISAGGLFDKVSGLILYFAYSVPTLVLGIFLVVFFAGGSYYQWFPIGGVRSDNFENFGFLGQLLDRVHHFVLPTLCYLIGGFTQLTMLMRNTMLDVIKMDYVRTARAKGLSENLVYFRHALRNALIPVATGLGSFFAAFLAGSLIIETIFDLDGIGKLSYTSIFTRDYNVIMGLTFISSLLLVMGRLLSDIIYVLIDPRIDFK
jgi:microcin C transport system permease protein